MKITILHNPRCSKSREALAQAQVCGAELSIIEYLDDTPSIDDLRKLSDQLGITPEALVRKKEKLYLEKYAGKKISPERWLKILNKYPVLIERPILIKGKKAVIGRSQEALDQILSQRKG